MSVVFERPYHFVPPHRGNLWPSSIQRLRLIDVYLRRREGVVDYECRHLERFQQSLQRGDGIVLAPNHCRYADPMALGWAAREARVHLYAMASWHLFNKSRFDYFALRRMGAFSVHRESTDRQSLETAVDILARAERPLVLFPEGTTNRTNDILKPLLDGVTFIARSAARRRAKKSGGKVVIHPVALKYLCHGDFTSWAEEQLSELETRIGWRRPVGKSVLERTLRIMHALLALKEVEFLGESRSGDLRKRRDELMSHLLDDIERRYDIRRSEEDSVRHRVRRIRTHISNLYFGESGSQWDLTRLKNDVAAADFVQDLLSFPDSYLAPGYVTDTRIVETIQRVQEAVFGKAVDTMPLRVVIEFDEAIEVPAEKAPRGVTDPLLEQLGERLSAMLDRLAGEANPVCS